jgi:hypothetical protein
MVFMWIRFWFSASEGLATRLAERSMRLRLLQSLTLIFHLPLLLRQRLLYEIGIVLQIPLFGDGGLKGSINRMLRQNGRLGLLSACGAFFHSIDQTSILWPKGQLDRLVNEGLTCFECLLRKRCHFEVTCPFLLSTRPEGQGAYCLKTNSTVGL